MAVLKTVFSGVIFSALFLSAVRSQPVEIVTENYPPFSFSEHGKIAGLSTLIVKTIMDESGLEYSINLYPWARAYMMVQNKNNVLIYSLTRTKEREESFVWLAKLHTPVFYLYSRSGKRFDPAGVRSGKYKAVAIRDDISCVWLRELGFSEAAGTLLLTSDYERSAEVMMVKHGRADFFIGEPQYTSARILMAGFAESDFCKVLKIGNTNSEGFYLAAGKNADPAMLKKIEEAAVRLKKKGISLSIAAE